MYWLQWFQCSADTPSVDVANVTAVNAQRPELLLATHDSNEMKLDVCSAAATGQFVGFLAKTIWFVEMWRSPNSTYVTNAW